MSAPATCPTCHGRGEVYAEAPWARWFPCSDCAPASQDAPEPDLTKPVNVDISDYSDEFCAGFVAGQQSIVDEIRAGRVVLDAPET